MTDNDDDWEKCEEPPFTETLLISCSTCALLFVILALAINELGTQTVTEFSFDWSPQTFILRQ